MSEGKKNLPGVSRTPDLKITLEILLQSRALASLATGSRFPNISLQRYMREYEKNLLVSDMVVLTNVPIVSIISQCLMVYL